MFHANERDEDEAMPELDNQNSSIMCLICGECESKFSQ